MHPLSINVAEMDRLARIAPGDLGPCTPRGSDGANPIHLLCEKLYGCYYSEDQLVPAQKVVKKLIRHNPQESLLLPNGAGQLPVHIGAYNLHMLGFLVELTPEAIKHPDRLGQTVLHYIAGSRAPAGVDQAYWMNRAAWVTQNKEHEISEKNNGQLWLSQLPASWMASSLDLVLARPEVEVNRLDIHGQSALHLAAQSGNYIAATLLLEHKDTFVSLTNFIGFDPMLEAAYWAEVMGGLPDHVHPSENRLLIMLSLLTKEASVNVMGFNGGSSADRIEFWRQHQDKLPEHEGANLALLVQSLDAYRNEKDVAPIDRENYCQGTECTLC
eukprot:TRINITY_DN24015_c0_g1_i1.p1 TRINITY_DN24015_c0_g1~~TRINITY_DN24015_c0_g1_i1.p1  ORF type:complete len:328 (+),score=68.57 TRINITY_DN24015_c0_g1_i1:364-1347(+)